VEVADRVSLALDLAAVLEAAAALCLDLSSALGFGFGLLASADVEDAVVVVDV
jgi:hypothetical protein